MSNNDPWGLGSGKSSPKGPKAASNNDPWGLGGGSSKAAPSGLKQGSNAAQAAALLPGILKSVKQGKQAPKRRGQFAALLAGQHQSSVDAIKKQTGASDEDIITALTGAQPFQHHNFFENAAQDLGNTISSVPRGVVGSAAAAGHEIAHGVADAFTHPFGHNPTPEKALSNLSHLATGNPTAQQQKDSPFTSATVESIKQTANRLSDPQQFLHDYSTHPFSSLAQDVGNASLILAPAAKVLEPLSAAAEESRFAPLAAAGRAGSSVAHGLELGGDVAGKINQGPFLPYTAPARLANKGVAKLGALVADHGGERAPLAEGASLAARTGEAVKSAATAPVREASTLARTLKIDPQSREVRAKIRAGGDVVAADRVAVAREKKLEEHTLNPSRKGPTTDEQAAMHAVGQGEAPGFAHLRQAKGPAALDQLITDHPEWGITPAAAHLAADVVEGKNPELAARVNDALGLGHDVRVKREAGYLAENPEARQWQTGYGADPTAVQKVLKPLQAKLDKATSTAEQARLRADLATTKAQLTRQNTTVGEFGPNLSNMPGSRVNRGLTTADLRAGEGAANLEGRAKVLGSLATSAETRQARFEAALRNGEANARYDIGNAPARLRPALSVNRAVQSALTDTVNSLHQAGLHDVAAEVAHVTDDLPTTLEQMRAQGVDPDHFIHVQLTDKPTATAANGRAPRISKGRSAKYRGTSQSGIRTIAKQAQGEVDELTRQAQNATAAEILRLPLAAKLGQEGSALEGVTDLAGARAAGYEPWDPRTPFATPGTITPETVFVPAHVKAAFRSYFDSPSTANKVLNLTYDRLTHVYKAFVLGLNPAWHIGKLASDYFLAGVGAGVDPVTLSANIVKAIHQYRASGDPGFREWSAPQSVLGVSSSHEAYDYLRPGEPRGAVSNVAGAPARFGYRGFQFLDNMMRSATYLGIKGEGFSAEEAAAIANRAMGDFVHFNQFERDVVRRIIPFYAWQRHITKLAFSLPIEHPMRTAWTLMLAQEFGQPDAWVNNLPPYLRTAMSLGSETLVPGRMFPFPVNPLEAITDPGASLNPLIKLGLQNFGPTKGLNFNTGEPFTRPNGTGRVDDFGKLAPTAPSIIDQLRTLIPQSRLADVLSGRKDIARYQSGDPVQFKTYKGADGKQHSSPTSVDKVGKENTIPTPQDRTSAILSALGFPIQPTSDLQNLALTTTLNKNAIAKQRGEIQTPAQQAKKKKAKSSSGGSSSTSSNPWGL